MSFLDSIKRKHLSMEETDDSLVRNVLKRSLINNKKASFQFDNPQNFIRSKPP